MKIKESLEKPGIFWLKFTILDAWDMSNGCMTNWATAYHCDPQKKLKCLSYGKISWIFIIKSEYSMYQTCSFFMACYTARAPINSMNLFYRIHY